MDYNQSSDATTGNLFAQLLFAIVLVVAITPSLTFAVLPEIPANGLDDDSLGGDLLFPGDDPDFDGYYPGSPLGEDCDQADFKIPANPWVMTGCTGLQAKKCNTGTGEYGSCTTPTEGSANYYIDTVSGSDSNDCSFADPCQTTAKFTDYAKEGDRPAGWIGLDDGDTLWFLNGLVTHTHSYGAGKRAYNCRLSSGSNGNLISFIAPVGSGGGISPASCNSSTPCAAMTFEGCSYWQTIGLEVTNGYGAGDPIEGSGYAIEGNNWKIIAGNIHDNQGVNGQNDAGITAQISPTNFTISHTTMIDNSTTRTPNHENDRHIVVFRPDGMKFFYNRVGNTQPYTHNDSSQGVVHKHGSDSVATDNEMHHNIMWNLRGQAFGSGTEKVRVYNNLIINSERCYVARNFGGTTFIKDGTIENNLCWTNLDGNGGFQIDAEVNSGSFSPIVFDSNIYVSAATSYGGNEGVFTLHTWGSDTLRTNFLLAGNLQVDNTCYFNSESTTLAFDDYSSSSSGGGPAGSMLSFAQWQALASLNLDAAGFVEDPELDEYFRAQSTNCDDKGFLTGSGGGGGDVTAPTLAEVTPVPNPTSDNTPDYTFSSDEAGTISYGGSCSSGTTSASSGNNTITFNTLSDGTYSNCTITVTDAATNASDPLSVTTFEVVTSPPEAPIEFLPFLLQP